MKKITGSILLWLIALVGAYGQEEVKLGGTDEWYWKLLRATEDGALNFKNKRGTNDEEILRARFYELGGMQLKGNLRIDGRDDGNTHSVIEFYRGNNFKFVKIGQADPNAPNSPFDFEDFNGNDFRFTFSGNEAVRIQASTRNVGIGTSTPYSHSRMHIKASTAQPWGILAEASGNDRMIGMGHDGTVGVIAVSALGTNNPFTPLQLRTSNEPRVTILADGKVGIGTANPDQMLSVKGAIHTEEVTVDMTVPGPDYVFEENYNLLSLAELEAYINANKHLPEVPSAREMEANGLHLKEMNLLLLKKVEELTLHLIEQKKVNDDQQKMIRTLMDKVSDLEKK